MVRGHQGNALVVVILIAQAAHGLVAAEQGLRGKAAQGADDAGLDDFDLALEIRLALLDLIGLGVSVIGRAALEYVADINLVAGQAHSLDDLGQQLPGFPHKGLARAVFFRSWGFADEHDAGRGIAAAKHKVLPRRTQPTASALANLATKGF